MAHDLRNAGGGLREIQELSEAGLTAQQLLAESAAVIDRVVPSDGYFMGATDPATTLTIGPGAHRDLPREMCQPTWDYEFLVPDYMKFRDIGRSGRFVADIHEETGGNPMRSPRWRDVGRQHGFHSEVRMTFSLGESIWGVAQLDRAGDVSRFSDPEKAWLAQASPLIAQGLRRAMLAPQPAAPAGRGPGVLLLDPASRMISATGEAAAWMEEIDSPVRYDTGGGVPIPLELTAYAARVRATEEGETAPPGRLRTRDGVWLNMHGSLLAGSDQLALVVEPAKAGDVAPLIVEAYGLSRRELDVVRLVARGRSTSEIAATLFLSPHTVRDHIKSVFEKTGVSSRGELVAKVFADHYTPAAH
ncbi:MAG TPA: helix-turn-helix transcriptional regulator [Solirubrobacteraceae bacterium]|nr:helix-turn-helix transcriptional regulator [Solirubrobacteraceae bacterium]